MPAREQGEDESVEHRVAHDILLRAVKLDAASEAPYQVAHLREAAKEAGISAQAFEQALRDGGRDDRPVAPFWVRLCLSGVPTRGAAMAFYYGFLAGIPLALGLAIVGLLPPMSMVTVGVALAFAGWSTGEAVRWQDRVGWNRRD